MSPFGFPCVSLCFFAYLIAGNRKGGWAGGGGGNGEREGMWRREANIMLPSYFACQNMTVKFVFLRNLEVVSFFTTILLNHCKDCFSSRYSTLRMPNLTFRKSVTQTYTCIGLIYHQIYQLWTHLPSFLREYGRPKYSSKYSVMLIPTFSA